MKIEGKEFRLFKIELKVLMAWLTITTGIILFIVLAGLVDRGSVKSVDTYILLLFREGGNIANPYGGKLTLEVMRDITALGGGTIITMITLFVAIYFLLRKNYSSLLLVIAAVIGGSLVGTGLKELFGRVRPDFIPHLMYAGSLSFPSGHSLMSAVIYISLAALVAESEKSRKIKIFLISSAAILSFMIGISRIYLGVHYPSDVAAGWAIGISWASLCWYIAWYIRRKKIAHRINHPEESSSGTG